MNFESDDLLWPRTATPPLLQSVLRARPEDFAVDELLDIPLSGAGEHLWLKVRKRGFNTDQVAQQLARAAGVPRRQVGYAGMKDRHAVTTQWFSLHLPGRDAPADWNLPPGIEVREAQRHSRKLQTGALTGNRFRIVLRDCAGDAAVLRQRIETIRRTGVPNYFGEQRFGRGGENVERARAMFAAGGRARDRHLQGIYLSAARALLFNAVLAERVRAGTWNAILPGEAVMLAGSRSFFVADDIDASLQQRLQDGDIHPSGPLWGRGELPARAAVQELELAVAAAHADLVRGLEAAGLRQERRALRLLPGQLVCESLDARSWQVSFSLPAGCFATALLRELADYRDAANAPPGGQT